MRAHALAKKLLSRPDDVVVVWDADRGDYREVKHVKGATLQTIKDGKLSGESRILLLEPGKGRNTRL